MGGEDRSLDWRDLGLGLGRVCVGCGLLSGSTDLERAVASEGAKGLIYAWGGSGRKA